MGATQDWRMQGEDERRGRGGGGGGGGRERRGRPPGVTFDVPEDPPENELEVKLNRAASRRRVRKPNHDNSTEQSS